MNAVSCCFLRRNLGNVSGAVYLHHLLPLHSGESSVKGTLQDFFTALLVQYEGVQDHLLPLNKAAKMNTAVWYSYSIF